MVRVKQLLMIRAATTVIPITILTVIRVATVRVTKVWVARTRNVLIQGYNDKKVDATMRLESGKKIGDKQEGQVALKGSSEFYYFFYSYLLETCNAYLMTSFNRSHSLKLCL